MSLRYKGAVISATPPTLVAGAGASGAWTLQQQMQAIASGYWPVNGPFYIEDVFSTYLYTGNGSTQTITNGIDLAGKGGLVWLKGRSLGYNNGLFDTVRGADFLLCSNNTDPSTSVSGIPANAWITGFNSNGFGLGSNGSANSNTQTYVSWTFREQPKFFDVVTYTGNGVAGRQIAHNLGSVPGCIIVKGTSYANAWTVYHRSLTSAAYSLYLNATSAQDLDNTNWNSTAPTSSVFTLGSGETNKNNETYVAYLFAHDAGGFGLTGSDNVISCGSFTTDGSGNATVTLGYEPQWLLRKRSSGAEDWVLLDVMRGFSQTQNNGLFPNLADAEAANPAVERPTATGFTVTGSSASSTYIYIAIRRGPMKTPTSGTSVYNAVTYTGNQTARNITGYGFPLDLVLGGRRNDTNNFKDYWFDRLRGATKAIDTNVSGGTAAEYTDAQVQTSFALQDGTSVGTDSTWNATGINIVLWGLRRAPGFFDVVCYTGTGSARTVSHNLGVVPELMIVKRRNSSVYGDWYVYTAAQGATKFLLLNLTDAVATNSGPWNNTAPTSSVFTAGSDLSINSTATYVAYLFATVAGVSKVGSYTGTGTTLQVDCGFTGGARFVLIKRTDSTGDWYVWDSARGIVAGNDPYLLLNSTAAEVTNTDYVDTYSAGFEISSTAPAAINANGGSFVFLAIA